MRRLPIGIVGGRDRVLREGMQDVGEQKLLMLLLVIDADLDQMVNLGFICIIACQQTLQRFVDMGAIGEDAFA